MNARQLHRRALRAFGLGALVLAAVAASPVWAENTIALEANWVDPPVLKAKVGDSVTIVNRTGEMVHVEFPSDARQHLVVQIPGIAPVRVTFLRPGIHPYVVHFPGTSRAALAGTVEVWGEPRDESGGQTCVEQTITGVCLER